MSRSLAAARTNLNTCIALCVASAIGALFNRPLQAFGDGLPGSQYLHSNWGPDAGLPGMVLAIAQTKDRYLWLGTQHGLGRFDGIRITLYTPKNMPGLASSWITALIADRSDTLWAGTYDGGLSRIRQGKVIKTYTVKDGLSSNVVRSLYADGKDGIWVGMYDGTLSHISQGVVVATFDPYKGRHPGQVNAVVADNAGDLWISDSAGLMRLENGRFSPYTIPDSGHRAEAVSLVADGGESLWAGTRVGLYHLEKGVFTRVWPPIVSHENTVWCIAKANDGTLWFGTNTGLNRLSHGKLDHFGLREGISGDAVYAIWVDNDGNVWLGTSGGFDKLSRRIITSYSVRQGLSANQVWAVTEDRHGAIWVGTDGGLDRIEGDRVRASYTTSNGLPSNAVYAVREGPDGSIWFATAGGLCRIAKGSLSIFGTRDGLPADLVVGITWRRDGTMLVAPRVGGVFSFVHGVFVQVLSLPARVHSISEGRDGSLWLSTDGQLGCWKDGRLTTYGSPSDRYTHSYEDASGTVWAGSRFGGLVSIKGGRMIRFAPLGAPFNDRIHHIFDDTKGNLWVTTPHGVFRIRMTELNDYANGSTHQVFAAPFGMADGLPSSGCNGGEQNAGWTDHEGRFWIPTGRGVAVLNPWLVNIDATPPHVAIEQVLVDDHALDLDAVIKLSADPRRIVFRYTGISLRAPQYVQFRYRLEGFDPNWVDGSSSREVSYTGLPPGGYRFRVCAGNRDGFWDLVGANLSFQVVPYFYQTTWFFGVCVSLALMGLGSAHRWRSRQIQERAEAVLVERTKIAREIHDTLLQGVAGASLALEAIASAIPGEDLRARFDQVLNEMQRCMTETRQALWDMRSSEVDHVGLAASLERYGHALADPAGIRFSIDVHGAPTRAIADAQRDLLLIGREAILNAIKHSRSKEIWVVLFFSIDSVRLRVDDDGRGFPGDVDAPGHWGLIGMRERAARLRADLSISTRPGGGTTVQVTAPLHRGDPV